MKALRPYAELAPVRAVGAVRPLLEQIGLVVAMMTQRRMPRPPRQTREPVANVLGLERGLEHRISGGLEREDRLLVRPRRLLEFERAELANAAAPGIGEAPAIEHLRDEPRRIEAAERGLGVRRVRQPHGADAAVAPGLRAY